MADTIKKPLIPPREVHIQVTHSMPPEKVEIFKSLNDWADKNILVHLKQVERCWQPQDFLPEPSSDGFIEEVNELRERAKELPDDYFVCLVGDMITEETLPTYQTLLNTFDGVRDETGANLTSWAIWTRGWTGEEKRHGDLLNKYLYLSGRVDMKQIEKMIQYLMGSGMVRSLSHTSDEKRHEMAYTKIVEKLFQIDPDGALLVFEDMMRKKILMPGHFMYDGHDENLFEHFSAVAQRIGIYTAKDYADILEHLIKRWKVDSLTGLSEGGGGGEDRPRVCMHSCFKD
ncbi:hypothetical protein QJS10_CPB13g01673 [Acorus calamus]|uniref:Acyl-[acyl-carrier-protein] desaturase n=1 Tax=Acorus calamus TaxID=4465 RepID=A0AAV9DH55_ACOCL|nr:hypothetical protein QJS10_CPB13g01673 [Acorus calamus]